MFKPNKLAIAAALSATIFGSAMAQKPAKPAPAKKAVVKSAAKATTPKTNSQSQSASVKTEIQANLPSVTDAGTRLVEVVRPSKDGKLVIPYAKFKMKNGLTIIVHEDHSDPICHVDVTYKVGSNREIVGKSGFAHFFEHMMFQGSENVGDEQHFKIVNAAGGELNGTTNTDRTNYFETLPSNQLEVALWLEADRMGFLLPAVTQKKFEIQRATVKNERGQNYDNRPYGLVGETSAKNLYPYGHPYSWSPIGYVEDLNRVDVTDLQKFFLRWYGPNNATLSVGGDVNTMEVVRLAEKYFGSIPECPKVDELPKLALSLDKNRYVSLEDKIRFPLLYITYPTVPGRHPDEAPLDALAEIIGGGSNSLLYQALDKKQLALQSGAGHPCRLMAGEFTIQIIPFPGKPLADMEKTLNQVFAEFEKRGVTDDDLARFKAGYESGTIKSLGEVSGKVSQLAAYETFYNNPNIIQEELDARLRVTKDDIMRVYNKYIKGKGAVVLSTVPKGQKTLIAAPDNYTIDTKNPVILTKDSEYEGLTYKKPVDNFDRSKQPKPGANPQVKVPDFWQASFPNGVKIIGAKNDELPTVGLLINIKGGHRLAQNNPAKAGVAALTAAMMNESTEKYITEEFESAETILGANIGVSAGTNNMSIYMDALTKNLDKSLELLQERMFKPAFLQEDFDRIKKQTIEGIENQATQPTSIVRSVFNKLVYGKENILSTSSEGTVESIKNITLDDVKEYYNKYFGASTAEVVVVGNVNQSEILPKLDFLKKWEAKPFTMPTAMATPKIEKTKIYLYDKEGAPQSEIRIGYMALPYDATGEYYRANLMNYMLGSAFNSRINLNLREDKGWTYGARSGFGGSDIPGPFVATAGVKATATDSSVFEFMKEMREYRDKGITAEELEFTKQSIGQSEARDYETLEQKAGFLSQILRYNLPKTYTEKQAEILKNMTVEEVNALAKKHLPVENMVIVVVGDKAKIEPGLKRLGYEIIEVDKDGNKAAPKPASTTTTPANKKK